MHSRHARSIWLLRALRLRLVTHAPRHALDDVIETHGDAWLSPLRDVLRRDGSCLDALRALCVFDNATMALLAAGHAHDTWRVAVDESLEHVTQRMHRGRGFQTAVILLMECLIWLWAVIFFQTSFLPRAPQMLTFDMTAGQLSAYQGHVLSLQTGHAVFTMFLVMIFVGFGVIAALMAGPFASIRALGAHLFAHLPFVATYWHRVAMVNACEYLGRCLRVGMTPAEAVTHTRGTVDEPKTRAYLDVATARLASSHTLADAFAHAPLSDDEQQLMRAVETSTELAYAMLAYTFEGGIKEKAARRWLVLAVFGAIVLWIAFALFSVSSLMNIEMKSLAAVMKEL